MGFQTQPLYLSYKEVLKKYPKYFRFQLECFIFVDEFNEEKEAEKILKLCKWFNGKPIGSCFYTTNVVLKKNRKHIEENLRDRYTTSKEVKSYDELYADQILLDTYVLRDPYAYKDKDTILKSLWYKNQEGAK